MGERNRGAFRKSGTCPSPFDLASDGGDTNSFMGARLCVRAASRPRQMDAVYFIITDNSTCQKAQQDEFSPRDGDAGLQKLEEMWEEV